MTHAEFAQGWKLLIVQPWGWRYRSLDAAGVPTAETKLQMEFYYDKLKWMAPEAWQEVAALFAQGEEWPSIGALNTAARQVNHKYVKALPPSPSAAAPSIDEAKAREILKRLGITLPQ